MSMSSFLLNPWTVGIGVVILASLLRVLWRKSDVALRPEIPGLVAEYVDGAYTHSQGPNPNEILCKWCGTLVIINPSPIDAFKLLVVMNHDTLLLEPTVAATLKSGESVEIPTQFCRLFDKCKLFPSLYTKPFGKIPLDLNPEQDCFPEELRHLTITLRCENINGQTFELACRRSDVNKKRLSSQPEPYFRKLNRTS